MHSRRHIVQSRHIVHWNRYLLSSFCDEQPSAVLLYALTYVNVNVRPTQCGMGQTVMYNNHLQESDTDPTILITYFRVLILQINLGLRVSVMHEISNDRI